MKYVIKYKFRNLDTIYTEEFTNVCGMFARQGDIIKQYKNDLEYCIYEGV